MLQQSETSESLFSFNTIKKGVMKASEILRITQKPQCTSYFCDGEGAYCAQGAIMNHFGWNEDGDMFTTCHGTSYWKKMMNLLNNDETIRREIAVRNNGMFGCSRQTFSQIADWLESKGL